MNGSSYDLVTPRGTKNQMISAVAALDKIGAGRTGRVLTLDEIAGLEENARRVAKKYWDLKGSGRTDQSLRNQLNRPRWHYLAQAPYAKAVLDEVARDAGMSLAYDP